MRSIEYIEVDRYLGRSREDTHATSAGTQRSKHRRGGRVLLVINSQTAQSLGSTDFSGFAATNRQDFPLVGCDTIAQFDDTDVTSYTDFATDNGLSPDFAVDGLIYAGGFMASVDFIGSRPAIGTAMTWWLWCPGGANVAQTHRRSPRALSLSARLAKKTTVFPNT